MNERPFARFIELVIIDQKIQSLSHRKNSLKDEIAALEQQKISAQACLEDAHKKIVQAKKMVDQQELELKDLDQKEKDKKKLLDQLSDYKEYQAIKHEIEVIHQLQIEKEQVVIDVWNELENAQHALKKRELDTSALMSELERKSVELQQNIQAVEDDLVRYAGERAEQVGQVPGEWLEKYDLMYTQVPNPVVPIVNQSCSACFQSLINQDIIRAKHAALLQCKKCFRLLYLPEAMERT